MTDLEAYEAIEALADVCSDCPTPESCGKEGCLGPYETTEDEPLCPNCCTPWKCNGPHLTEGAEVTAYDKPGTVRWVTPWNSVAVVFEDGQMLWFAGDDVDEIEERD